MSGVPTKILVGPTTYVHFRRKHKDYFVPDFLATPEPPAPDRSPHVWRYTVSADHHNTVFFYNAASKRSVWVLPVVHHDGHVEELGEGEAMHAVHSSLSASAGLARRGSDGETTSATADATPDEVEKRPEKVAGQAGAGNAAEDDAATAFPAVKNVPAASSSAVDERETKRAADAVSGSTAVASATLSSDHVSRARVQAAVQRAQLAGPLNLSIGATKGTAQDNAVLPTDSEQDHHPHHRNGSSASLQERLAAWRARRHQSPSEDRQETSNAVPQEVPAGLSDSAMSAPLTSQKTTKPNVTPSPQPTIQPAVSALPTETPVLSDPLMPTAHVKVAEKVASADLPPSQQQQEQQTSFASPPQGGPSQRTTTDRESPTLRQSRPTAEDAAALQRRQRQNAEMAEATALLHQEKIAAMTQERAALECRRRALAVAQREADERARMETARTAAARDRQERSAHERAAEERRRRNVEAAAAAEARVRDVNAFVSTLQSMEAAAEATVAESHSYAARVAAQLAACAPRTEELHSAVAATAGEELGTSSSKGVQGPSFRLGKDRSIAFREHHVGRDDVAGGASNRASPLRTLHNNVAAPKDSLRGADVEEPRTQRRQQQELSYGVPFVYVGDVVRYQPAQAFCSQSRLRASSATTSPPHPSSPSVLALPDPPALLAVKRDGTGTEYYDAEKKHFFKGEWRDDQRSGAGVLSLPTCAVQGRWKEDALTGAAVIQTRHAKANATVAPHATAAATTMTHRAATPTKAHASDHPPRHSTSAAAVGVARAGSSFAEAPPSAHLALTGNAVVGLDNAALFAGSLRGGRVAAPYVLQLGEGDYIEWLGTQKKVPSKKGGTAGQRVEGAAKLSVPQVSGRPNEAAARRSPPLTTLMSHTQAGTSAGTGECRIRFHNGDTYVGHVRDFQLHGMGYYRFGRDGQSYTGTFQHGLPHGEGLMIFANGDLYQGHFAKGVFDGHGSYSCAAGKFVYEGSWEGGEMTGEGTILYANGDVWRGTFRNSTRVSGVYTTVA